MSCGMYEGANGRSTNAIVDTFALAALHVSLQMVCAMRCIQSGTYNAMCTARYIQCDIDNAICTMRYMQCDITMRYHKERGDGPWLTTFGRPAVCLVPSGMTPAGC